MFAIKLARLVETHADELSEGLMQKIKTSARCKELIDKVPPGELKRRTREIYDNLTEWLMTKTEAEVEEAYIGLGARRARQGVPFSNFFWAICATKEQLWEYLQRQGLFEEPVDFWGGMELVHAVAQFFDSALYYATIGYESAHKAQVTQVLTASSNP
ncbi:MAG TPA: hypothetical protein VMT53_23185 [Terriglobales bacterium]|nr:hypothetical protein [Terriglobales bacterium]